MEKPYNGSMKLDSPLRVAGHFYPTSSNKKVAPTLDRLVRNDASSWLDAFDKTAHSIGVPCQSSLMTHPEDDDCIETRPSDLRVDFHYRLEPSIAQNVMDHVSNIRPSLLLITSYIDPERQDWQATLSVVGADTGLRKGKLVMPDKMSFERSKKTIICKAMQLYNRLEMQKLVMKTLSVRETVRHSL